MATDLTDIPKLLKIIRKLASAVVVDRETRERIAEMSDEEVLDFADQAIDRAEAQNNALLSELEKSDDQN